MHSHVERGNDLLANAQHVLNLSTSAISTYMSQLEAAKAFRDFA